MRVIDDWTGLRSVAVAESKTGVLVTCNPYDNLITADLEPWPTPEILQKLYASDRFKGGHPKTMWRRARPWATIPICNR